MFARYLRPAISLLVVMTLLLGIVYPLAMTAIAGLAFPHRASGSLVFRDGRLVGSGLIGQAFSEPKYFWGRPSATAPQPYNGTASSGSNLGPLNPALIDQVRANVRALRDADPADHAGLIPVDLVTASASGLDPDISVAGALWQVARVARARGIAPARIEALVAERSKGRLAGLIGEQRVNVLDLNLALDQMR